MTVDAVLGGVLLGLFALTQVLYSVALGVDLFFNTRRVDWVAPEEITSYSPARYPMVILLYPVLRELEATMRTTFLALAKIDYPADRFRIVAIPNEHDGETIASLRRLEEDFPFLELMLVPPTSDPSWELVWCSWANNEKAYWWHRGSTKRNSDLPPKKTRQLVHALYHLAEEMGEEPDWLLDYIDADSAPPVDHFRAGAAGMERFDVIQATNVAGNLLDSWAASLHAMDHMTWDGMKYPHLSSDGTQPFWVLGKGVFYRGSDLIELGGFNPWVAIEDPEVGLRLWVNGRRLGIVAAPLIEEVPSTFRGGIMQRKRWVCGFLQSSSSLLTFMGMTFRQRMRARLNVWPCFFLAINPIGIPLGIWAIATQVEGRHGTAFEFLDVVSTINLILFVGSMTVTYRSTWKRTGYVLSTYRRRLQYMFRVNPAFLWVYWLVWTIPIVLGTKMFLSDGGRVWERTDKTDANHDLVRHVLAETPVGYVLTTAVAVAGSVEDLPDSEGEREVDLAAPPAGIPKPSARL